MKTEKLISKIELQEDKKKSTMSEILLLIEEKILRNKEGRITEPFQAKIDKKSITVGDLKRMGGLTVEQSLTHLIENELILNTGSKNNTSPDYDVTSEAIGSSVELRRVRFRAEQTYTAHNHPTNKPDPSLQDLIGFSNSKADLHFILTSIGVNVCSTPKNIQYKIEEFKKNNNPPYAGTEKYINFRKEIGIKEKFVKFEEPDFSTILNIFRGDESSGDFFKANSK